ncbi:hypothetical protein C8F04DRAFT_1088166 [Mycena alexandri]|uniref:F-box domain-containing protein n=1 Tax=Mycena alexandri TaxID=1745969 RepID=A0AAD6X4R7_9AGAR|nr:hypothetical protein C8F04DRAFT_1088166 [Mycena alexandri]
MSTLPGELVDAIIDWTNLESPPSLAAYALVSKQWLPRSRYHYFASINLTRDRSTDTVKTFLYLIASPLVTFISSVREVQLHHRSSYAIPVFSAGDLIALLSSSGIYPTRLTLDCHFTQFGIQNERNSFTSITQLQLSFYGEVSLEKLFIHLSIFPFLESLSLAVHNAGSELGWISLQPHKKQIELPPNLHELSVHQPSILRCLTSIEFPLARFTALILQSIHLFPEVNRYLTNDVISCSLVSLTLDNCITDEVPDFDLSHLDVLQHLHIQQHYMWTAIAVLETLASISRSPSPRALQTIALLIYGIDSIDCEDMAPWRELDAILASSDSHIKWPQLHRLSVRGHNWRLPVDVPHVFSRAVRENMPSSVERGMLVIS